MSIPVEDHLVKMSFNEIVDYLNSGIVEAESVRCISRSSRLQREQCVALDLLMYNAMGVKHEASRRGQEDLANLLLGFECAIGSLRSELLMYILIKREMQNEAWDRLVAAQMGCLDAARAHSGFAHLRQRLQELEELEVRLFPPQVFLSAGFVSERIDCSICGERYANCEHLRGKPYMGNFCEFIHRKPVGDHVALVKSPEDKRCRVISVKTKDGHRDKISSETTSYEEGEKFEEDGALEVHTIFMALNRYPYLESTEAILGLQHPALKSEEEIGVAPVSP